MVNAYHTYKQQWTATDKKKMVKDASKALQVHFTTFILNLTAHGVCMKSAFSQYVPVEHW